MKFIHTSDWHLGKTKEKSMAEIFKEFYFYSKGVEPRGELMNLFLEITNEEGEIKDEAN